jgi:hypothetical protein
VVVGAAGEHGRPLLLQGLGQGGGVVDDPPGVVGEGRPGGLGQGDRLGGHDVAQRPAQDQRAAAVHGGGELLGAQHHPAPRPPQRLVGGGGDHLGVGHRVEVAAEHLAGDQAGEVGHVDHEHGPDLVGDLAEDAEVDPARIGAVAGQQDQRPEALGLLADLVVVEQPGGGVDGVAGDLEQLAGHVGPEAVGEVAARVQGHAEQALVAELAPQRLPLGVGQALEVLGPRLLQHRGLDPPGQDGPEGDQVGVDAAVRLDVGVVAAEQALGQLHGPALDGVDVVAAGVEAVPGRALGVLVRQPVAHGQQGCRGGEVLAGDQLEVGPLVGQLGRDGRGDLGRRLADHLHGGREGDGLGADAAQVGVGADGAEIGREGGVGVHVPLPVRWRPPAASYPRPSSRVGLPICPILRVTSKGGPPPPPAAAGRR